jgi:hypothetical protein
VTLHEICVVIFCYGICGIGLCYEFENVVFGKNDTEEKRKKR